MLGNPLIDIEHICYINLEHREDRKKHILTQLDSLGIPKEKIIRINAVQDLMNGHRGCAHSHILALKEAQKRGTSVLILEDDCEFIENTEEIYALCKYFFSTVKNEWDVFMLGGQIKKREPTEFNKIYRVISSRCAHAYCVHKNYIPKVLLCFQTSLELTRNFMFSFESYPYAIDREWVSLQQKDRWYMVRMIADQLNSYSDIEWKYRTWNLLD